MGKFYLIDAAVSGGYTWLGVVIVVGSMISLGYYLPVIAAMWMREAPERPGYGDRSLRARCPGPAAAEGALPALAGGSPELDEGAERRRSPRPAERDGAPGRPPTRGGPRRAIVAGAATLFFGIVPEPLFNLVHGVGSALGLL